MLSIVLHFEIRKAELGMMGLMYDFRFCERYYDKHEPGRKDVSSY